eukprot:5941227-Alexandrium_andersonii.AAC.1
MLWSACECDQLEPLEPLGPFCSVAKQSGPEKRRLCPTEGFTVKIPARRRGWPRKPLRRPTFAQRRERDEAKK